MGLTNYTEVVASGVANSRVCNLVMTSRKARDKNIGERVSVKISSSAPKQNKDTVLSTSLVLFKRC